MVDRSAEKKAYRAKLDEQKGVCSRCKPHQGCNHNKHSRHDKKTVRRGGVRTF